MQSFSCRDGARLVAIVASVFGLVTQAHASTGCDAINAGAWNVTNYNSGNIFGTATGFNVGDKIDLVFTAQGGNVTLFSTSAALASSPAPNSPTNLSYTVTGADNDTGQIDAYYVPMMPNAMITNTATCIPGPAPGPGPGPGPGPNPSPSSSDASKAVAKGFLAARVNGILLGDPNATSLLNRTTQGPLTTASAANGNTNVASRGTFGGAMGLGAGLGAATGLGNTIALGDDGQVEMTDGKSVQFSGSLSQMRRQARDKQMERDRMGLGAGDGGALPLAYDSTSPWDIWIEGRYSAFDDDNANLARDGHVGVLYVGGDYRIAQNMIVGALVQFDWSKDSSDFLSSKVDGNGWMIGPYLSAQIHDNIYFDLRAAWGRSNNDLSLETVTGGFDTSRWLVKGTLAGNWLYDAWRFTPSAELAYVEESADAFTNSAGTFVEGQNVSLGRLQFGPEIGYRFAHTATTFIEPFAAIRGVWDFDNPNVAIIDGFVVGPGDFWGRLQGGLNVQTAGGTYVRGLASWDGLGASDYNGYTLQGTINVPLN